MRLSTKLLVISELVLLTAVLILVTPVWWAMRGQVIENMQNELKAIASTAALQVDGDLHRTVRTMDDAESDAFGTIQAQLARVRRANGVELSHIYTMYRDGASMRFAVMLNPDDELFIGDTYPIQSLMGPVLEEGAMSATELYRDEYGRWISAYAPIRDSNGQVVGLLAVDKDSEEYFSRFIGYTLLTIALGLVALGLSSVLGYWVLNRIVIKPVGAVREGMLAIGRHDFGHRVELTTNDELQELGETLNGIVSQFDAARVVQSSFLPRTLPQGDGWTLAAASIACDATGGDYYDAFTCPDGRIAVVLADVSGHGLAPSLLMASCRATLRGLSRHEGSPGALLHRLGELLAEELGAGRFITLIYGVLDPDGLFTYSNFGHGPAMVVVGGRVETLDSHRPPLGISVDLGDEPLETSLSLGRGDRVFFASDGLTESFDADGRQLGLAAVESMVREAPTSDELVEQLLALQQAHSGGPSQTDDITMLSVDRVR